MPSRQSCEGATLQLAAVASVLDRAGMPFFTQDRSLRFVEVNDVLLETCGGLTRSAVLGCEANRLFVDAAARQLRRLALEVMRTLEPLSDRQVLWAPLHAAPMLAHVSLWPLTLGSQVNGVFAAARIADIHQPAMRRVAEAAAYIHTNVGGRLDVPLLADRAGVSLSQFQRDFQSALGVTPKHYITTVRFEQALDRLLGGESIASVAHSCGYADQSAFTRRFSATLGMPPTAYIKRVCAESAKRSAAATAF